MSCSSTDLCVLVFFLYGMCHLSWTLHKSLCHVGTEVFCRKELFPLPVADLLLVIICGVRTDGSDLCLGKGVDCSSASPKKVSSHCSETKKRGSIPSSPSCMPTGMLSFLSHPPLGLWVVSSQPSYLLVQPWQTVRKECKWCHSRSHPPLSSWPAERVWGMDCAAFHLYWASFVPGFGLVSWGAEFSCYAGRTRHLLQATCQQNFHALKIHLLNQFFVLFQSSTWVKTKYFESTNGSSSHHFDHI